MTGPLVSVILPVFDRAGSIARAIESVLAQSYGHVELIVVDDGSTDGTAAILEAYRGTAAILRQANGGAYAARNLALRHATGEHVAFIDSDDAWLPHKLERQVPLMRPGIGLVYGDVDIVTAPDDRAPRTGMTAFKAVAPVRGRALEAFARGNFVPTSTVLVRGSALQEIGGFPESRISADYLAWFRIAQAYAFDFVDAPVALYTQHQAGISHDLGRSLAARISLFRAERERTRAPAAREVLDRLLFNLGVSMALAAVRGRARTIEQPFRLARSAAAGIGTRRALLSAAAFAANQMKIRAKWLFS
ncbi:MAG: glycosyl transferase family 2 [Alphaproteobacteria bacterium]|nr:glycosyl transferase family 2 [Alphaproteobacteria bacterium]